MTPIKYRLFSLGIFLFSLLGVVLWLRPAPARADYRPVTPKVQGVLRYALSDDNRYLASIGLMGTKDGNLYLTDLTTEAITVLNGGNRMWADDEVYFAHNNQWIYFTEGYLRNDARDNVEVYRVPITGGQPRLLLAGQDSANFGFESSDGRYLTMGTYKYATSAADLRIFDTDTGTMVTVPDATVYKYAIAFTPDNSTLVYSQLDGEGISLKYVPVTGGGATTFYTHDTQTVGVRSLSPDGKFVYAGIAFGDMDSSYRSQLHRIALDGSGAVPIGPLVDRIGDLTYSPDATYGFFTAVENDTTTLYRLTLSDDSLTVLYSSTDYWETYGTVLMPSEGDRLLFIGGYDYESEPVSVYSINYRTAAPPIVLATLERVENSPGLDFQLSADGSTLYFTGIAGGRFGTLSRVPVDGSHPAEALTTPAVYAFALAQEEDSAFVQLGTAEVNGGRRFSLAYLDFSHDQLSTLYTPLAEDIDIGGFTLNEALPAHRVLFTLRIPPDIPYYSNTAIHVADLRPTARFITRTYGTIAEGGTRPITIEVLPPPTAPLTVSYSVISGTATLEDVMFSPDPLVFAAGQTTQTLTMTALRDAADEPLEGFTLVLEEPTAADPASLTITVSSAVYPVSDAPIASTLGYPRTAVAATQDGRTVVFSETTTDGSAFYQYDLDTGTKTLLYDGATRTDIAPVFAPDDQSVFFVTSTDVRRATLGNTTPALVIPHEGCIPNIQVAPPTPYALVRLTCTNLQAQDRLLRLDLATNAVTTLATAPSLQRLAFAKMTIRGTVVYVVQNGTSGTVYEMSLDGGGATMRGDVALDGRFIDVTPRGTALFYTLGDSLYRWRAGTTMPEMIADNVTGNIVMVPHGDYLLYTHEYTECDPYDCHTVYQSYLVSTEGTQVAPLDCSQISDDWFFSPDGDLVAYDLSCLLRLDGRTTAIGPGGFATGYGLGNTHLYGIRVEPPYWDFRLSSLRLDGQGAEDLFLDKAMAFHTVTAGDVMFFSDADGYLYSNTDRNPAVQYATVDALLGEGDSVEVTVSLASTPLETVTVDYALTGGTATEGDDFTFTSGTLTFAPFERTKTFTVEVLEDGTAEAVETAVFTLSNIEGGTPGAPTTYTLKIADEVYTQQLPILTR